jgi:hypothetical protein
VVRDARGGALTKRYHLRGGRLVKSNYPNVAEVVAAEVPVDGIDSLATALDSVTAGGIAAVTAASPVSSIRAMVIRLSDSCGRRGASCCTDRRPDLARTDTQEQARAGRRASLRCDVAADL